MPGSETFLWFRHAGEGNHVKVSCKSSFQELDLNWQAGRRSVIKDAAKSPIVTQKELHSSTAQSEGTFDRKAISHALHKRGLYESVPRRKPLLKENYKKSSLQFARSHVAYIAKP